MNLIIGSHVSFNKNEQLLGSVKEAVSYKSNCFMFYTGAPQNTVRVPISIELKEKAYKLMMDNKIDVENVIVHAPYIVNLANPKNFQFNVDFLKQEISRISKMHVNYIDVSFLVLKKWFFILVVMLEMA